jgi:hypothetical protein
MDRLAHGKSHLLQDIFRVTDPHWRERKCQQDAYARDKDTMLHQDRVHPKWRNLQSHHNAAAVASNYTHQLVMCFFGITAQTEESGLYE